MFDKITARIEHLCEILPKLDAEVDAVEIAQKVVSGIFSGVKTTELDNLAAETAAYMSTRHPDYGVLAARIAISNLQKQTSSSFFETMKLEHEYINPKTNERAPLVSDEVFEIIKKNADVLDKAIKYERDFDYDFFGFKTLERSYLPKLNNVIVERPQHMLMRVAVGIHKEDIPAAIETYLNNYRERETIINVNTLTLLDTICCLRNGLFMLLLHFSTLVQQDLKCLLVSLSVSLFFLVFIKYKFMEFCLTQKKCNPTALKVFTTH